MEPAHKPQTKKTLPGKVEVAANRREIEPYINKTPVLHLNGPAVVNQFGHGTELFLKLETFQPTGSFKVRSVMSFLNSLSTETIHRGLITMSAGNHAAAVSYGAKCFNTHAKVIMPKGTNPYKIALSEQFGAEVIFIDEFHQAQAIIDEAQSSEGRVFVPAWGDSRLILGTASLALELTEQIAPLDAFLVAIGGGSICAGAGSYIRKAWPGCKVLAAEPEGADTMLRSFASGKVEYLRKRNTIAEGLAPPNSCEYLTPICRDTVNDLKAISDQNIVEAMRFLFAEAKLAIEPSGAGALAGAFGPYREQISGRRSGIVVSGSNIDFQTFESIINTANGPIGGR